ncbi:hypothetical protein AB0940_05775 [Streptomyces sp. NPDC006656]|uniref:hypothetical protein n=1 Tax=Streptomyces sp. NPDC006656 TaxID=3156899 RepID=UPI00345622DF
MATPNVDRSCGSDVSLGSPDKPLPRVRAVDGPSVDLLDRALIGWERFLDTFEVASGE